MNLDTIFFVLRDTLQGRYNFSSFMSVALGGRLDYLDLTEEVSIQPRGSVNFELPIGSNLRFGYGHYEQSPKTVSDTGRKWESSVEIQSCTALYFGS